MELLIVLCATFLGTGLKAIGGFGFATLATPAIALFWDVPTAIAVVSVPNIVTSFLNGYRTREALQEGLRPFFIFFLAGLIGLIVGLTILFNADPGIMKLLLGFFLIGQVIWQYLKNEGRKAPEDSFGRGLGMGFIAGLMLGTINMPSHVIASYLTGMRLRKSRYLFVMSFIQVILRTAAVILLIWAGVFNWEIIKLIAITVVPIGTGYFVGSKIYKWLPDRIFFLIVNSLLFVMAMGLVLANAQAGYTFRSSLSTAVSNPSIRIQMLTRLRR